LKESHSPRRGGGNGSWKVYSVNQQKVGRDKGEGKKLEAKKSERLVTGRVKDNAG